MLGLKILVIVYDTEGVPFFSLNSNGLRPQFPVQGPVLDGLGDMASYAPPLFRPGQQLYATGDGSWLSHFFKNQIVG